VIKKRIRRNKNKLKVVMIRRSNKKKGDIKTLKQQKTIIKL